jgi:hypothetical protein
MKRTRFAIAAIMALLAITATALTAIASGAEPTVLLPTPTAASPVTATATSGEGQLVQLGGATVICKKDKGSVRFTTSNLGTGTVLFESCTTAPSLICTGVGDATGTIEQFGSVHYLLALEMLTASTTTLVAAFAFLVKQFHFICKTTGIEVLVLVKGCVAAKADGVPDTSPGTLLKVLTILFAQFVTGETKILSILMENTTGEETKCLLESVISTGTSEAFTLSALVGDAVLEKWTQGGEEIDMLFMN